MKLYKWFLGMFAAVAMFLGGIPLASANTTVPIDDLDLVEETVAESEESTDVNYRYYRPYYRPYFRPYYRPYFRPYYRPYYRPYFRPYYRPYYRPYRG